MQNYNLRAAATDSKERLDKFLVNALGKKYSRTFIRKLIDEKNVLVNGESASAHHRLSPGEEVRVEIPEPEKLTLKPEGIPLKCIGP